MDTLFYNTDVEMWHSNPKCQYYVTTKYIDTNKW